METTEDLVMFLRGRVATSDGTRIPHDVKVERICNGGVRQQVYASPNGGFDMQLGTRDNDVLDASAVGRTSPVGANPNLDPSMGVSRRQLLGCELRATASGFRSNTVSLMDVDVLNRSLDVGVLVVERTSKMQGATLSAIPYKAPQQAWKAYEKGLEAEKNNKFAEARKYLEKAVAIFPRYAVAWFELGTILQKENQKEGAREAYTRAATIDFKFLPPFVSLAALAYGEGNWTEVLDITSRIADLDPWKQSASNGYIMDADGVNYTAVYFYEAVANYKLNRMAAAEKSGLQAEHYLDVGTRFPQLHLLMADIFLRKNNNATAISELETYLQLAPHAANADSVKAQLVTLKQKNVATSIRE
jgi:hypothetical protein